MSDWRVTAIDDIAVRDRYSVVGGPFGSALGRKDYVAHGVPVIRGAQLGGPSAFSHDDLVFVSDEKADRHSGNLAYPGDVLITQRGTVGQVGRIPEDAPYPRYLLSQSQMKVTVDPSRADARFIYYALLSPAAQQSIHGSTVSAGVPHINLATFRALELTVPSPLIQRRIARILGTMDDLIESGQRRIGLLEQMAKAIYREWFVRFRYPGHEAAVMVDSSLGSIPEGWTVKTVGELSTNFDRLRKPLSRVDRDERSGPFPYYGAAKLIDWIDDWIFDGEYLLFAEDGTVQTRDGFPVLQLVDRKFWANNHTHILQGFGVSTRFLFLASAGHPIAGYVTGAAQPKITQANLHRIPMIVGPAAVHGAFDEVIDPIFDAWNVVQASIAPLQAIRDLLLPKLVTGQIDVSNLDLDALVDSVA